jgi:hypothetical protein
VQPPLLTRDRDVATRVADGPDHAAEGATGFAVDALGEHHHEPPAVEVERLAAVDLARYGRDGPFRVLR